MYGPLGRAKTYGLEASCRAWTAAKGREGEKERRRRGEGAVVVREAIGNCGFIWHGDMVDGKEVWGEFSRLIDVLYT